MPHRIDKERHEALERAVDATSERVANLLERIKRATDNGLRPDDPPVVKDWRLKYGNSPYNNVEITGK